MKLRNQRFDDKDFPRDNRSLFSDPKKHTKQDGHNSNQWSSDYEWHRLLDICGDKDAKVFVNGTESGDVVQGALGDCYLLGALAGLDMLFVMFVVFVSNFENILVVCVLVCASRPVVSPLFVTQMPQLGLYQIRFFKDEWKVCHLVISIEFRDCVC